MKHAFLTTIFLSLLFAYCIPSPLQAYEVININGIYYTCSRKYYVEEDENGVYLRTEQDFSWSLDEDDLDIFKLGESGFYYIETKGSKPYILTDKKRVFYFTFNPMDTLVNYNQGLSYYYEGQYDRAIANFNKAIRIDPKNDRA